MSKTMYDPHPSIAKKAYVRSMNQYKEFYKKSIDNPEEFWGEISKQFYWETPADANNFFSYNFDVKKGPISIKWMEGASTNISYNLLDKNIKNGMGDKIAYYCFRDKELLRHLLKVIKDYRKKPDQEPPIKFF